MRVLLSTCRSRGGLEPMVGHAVRLRALGAKLRVCVPPDCAEWLAEGDGRRTDGATVAATLLLDRS